MVLGLIAGGGLCILIICFIYLTSDTIRISDELQVMFGMNELSRICVTPNNKRFILDRMIIGAKRKKFFGTEEYQLQVTLANIKAMIKKENISGASCYDLGSGVFGEYFSKNSIAENMPLDYVENVTNKYDLTQEKFSDGAVLIIEAERTKYTELMRVQRLLLNQNIKLLGYILIV